MTRREFVLFCLTLAALLLIGGVVLTPATTAAKFALSGTVVAGYAGVAWVLW